jgi:hypothetical protein
MATGENSMKIPGTKRQVVAQYQRALLLKHGQLRRVLGAGVHRWLDPAGALECVLYDLSTPELVHPHSDVFRHESAELWNAWVDTVETGAREAGLVYLDRRLRQVIPPLERRFFWQGPIAVRVERVDLSADPAVDAELAPQLLPQRRICRGRGSGQVQAVRPGGVVAAGGGPAHRCLGLSR